MPSRRASIVSLLLVTTPVLFVWHAELVLVYPASPSSRALTNGFFELDGGVVYHALMYALFAVNFAAAAYLLTTDGRRPATEAR